MLLQSNQAVNVAGVYVEVGQGGGKVKRAQRVELKTGDKLPELKAYKLTLVHKGNKKEVTRQHKWKLA